MVNFKILFPVLLIILVSSPVFAEIVIITGPKSLYNIGDSIDIKFSVSSSQGLEVISRVGVLCDNYNIEYFVTPVSLVPNKVSSLSAPKKAISGEMVGQCSINIDIEKSSTVIESISSDAFTVTDKLDVEYETAKDRLLPGDTLKISGSVDSTLDDLSAEGVAILNGEEYEVLFYKDTFSADIKLPENIKSHENKIRISVKDDLGNSALEEIPFTIIPVPSSIKVYVSEENVKPLDQVRFDVNVLDQAGALIDSMAKIVLKDSRKNILKETSLKTTDHLSFLFPQFQKPGDYYYLVNAEGLSESGIIIVEEFENLEISFSGEEIILWNLGNIKYDKEIKLDLRDAGEEITLIKKVSLAPNQTKIIDLSKEVPTGTYTVDIGGKSVLMDIVDSRSALKKFGQFMSKITAGFIGPGGVANKFIYAIIILAALAYGIFYYLHNKKNVSFLRDISHADSDFSTKKKKKIFPSGIIIKDDIKAAIKKSKDKIDSHKWDD